MATATATSNAATDGDARRFASQAHAQHDEALRRYFARRGLTRDDADDLIQEVYLRLVRQDDVGSIRCAQAFIFTTAANLLRDRYRRHQCHGPLLALDDDHPDIPAEGFDPERSAECSQLLQAMCEVIDALRPATRRVFLGHRLRGQSYAELAHELGVSISMVEKHMISAIAALNPLALAAG